MGECFEAKNIHPAIRRTIETVCKPDVEAHRQATITELIGDPEALSIINWAIERCPQQTQRTIAGNMLDWLSAYYTDGKEDLTGFSKRFDRRKHKDGTWSYFRHQ